MIVVGSFAFIFFVCGVHEATDFLMDSFGILALGESFKVFIVYLWMDLIILQTRNFSIIIYLKFAFKKATNILELKK